MLSLASLTWFGLQTDSWGRHMWLSLLCLSLTGYCWCWTSLDFINFIHPCINGCLCLYSLPSFFLKRLVGKQTKPDSGTKVTLSSPPCVPDEKSARSRHQRNQRSLIQFMSGIRTAYVCSRFLSRLQCYLFTTSHYVMMGKKEFEEQQKHTSSTQPAKNLPHQQNLFPD